MLALALASVMLLTCLAGCAKKGEPLMTLGKNEISVNLFELYLSRMKGILSTTAYFGSSATKDEFWDTWVDTSSKTTYNTKYTQVVLEDVKMYLAALAVFDEKKLELPKSYIEEIDAELEKMVQDEAEGSKTAFNAIIGEFGVNYDMLREAYIIEAKIDYLQESLFGENGSKISPSIIEEYYSNNYARFKQIFLRTYEYEYVVDRNNDLMYFTSDGKISYDTTKTAKTNANGDYVSDEDGQRVYVYTDSEGTERIAYKKEGATTQIKTDSSGNKVIRNYNEAEKAIIAEEAKEILAKTQKGDTLGFDILLATERNEDDGAEEYPNGYYVTENTNYASPEVIEKLFDIEVGEAAIVPSDYGYHIIMRYPTDKGAYAKDENKDMFISNDTGTYLFMDNLIAEQYVLYLKEYVSKIVVDEKLYATVDIKRAGVNYYY